MLLVLNQSPVRWVWWEMFAGTLKMTDKQRYITVLYCDNSSTWSAFSLIPAYDQVSRMTQFSLVQHSDRFSQAGHLGWLCTSLAACTTQMFSRGRPCLQHAKGCRYCIAYTKVPTRENWTTEIEIIPMGWKLLFINYVSNMHYFSQKRYEY